MTKLFAPLFGLLALAASAAACGSTASASSTVKTTAALAGSKPCRVNALREPIPPAKMPKVPVANSCWAGNFYLGNGGTLTGSGTLHNRKIIFADKMANYSLDQLTPQLIRTNPVLAQTVLKVAEQFMYPGLGAKVYNAIVALSKAGDSYVPTGTNPQDPTGLLLNRADVLVGGTSSIPESVTTAPATTATVQECINSQEYLQGPNKLPVAGIDGYYGYTKSTDTLVKTSSGWVVQTLGAGTQVSSC